MYHTPLNLEQEDIQRFLNKIQFGNLNECWPWLARCFENGYGQFKLKRTVVKAHRVAFYLARQLDPEEFLVLHECDNPPCCNPKHLFLGTNKDNTKDSTRKGRRKPQDGENNAFNKLTELQVEEIRQLAKTFTQQEIADYYGICQQNVSWIITKKSWNY